MEHLIKLEPQGTVARCDILQHGTDYVPHMRMCDIVNPIAFNDHSDWHFGNQLSRVAREVLPEGSCYKIEKGNGKTGQWGWYVREDLADKVIEIVSRPDVVEKAKRDLAVHKATAVQKKKASQSVTVQIPYHVVTPFETNRDGVHIMQMTASDMPDPIRFVMIGDRLKLSLRDTVNQFIHIDTFTKKLRDTISNMNGSTKVRRGSGGKPMIFFDSDAFNELMDIVSDRGGADVAKWGVMRRHINDLRAHEMKAKPLPIMTIKTPAPEPVIVKEEPQVQQPVAPTPEPKKSGASILLDSLAETLENTQALLREGGVQHQEELGNFDALKSLIEETYRLTAARVENSYGAANGLRERDTERLEARIAQIEGKIDQVLAQKDEQIAARDRQIAAMERLVAQSGVYLRDVIVANLNGRPAAAAE